MKTMALMYHDVVRDERFESSGCRMPGARRYKLDAREFRRHLRILTAAPAPKSVLLTFDDGGAGAVTAAEILEEFGLTGRFFITTDWIGSPGFLDEPQIWQLRGRGHLVGSHSCSHPARMSHCAPAELDREWSESVRRLARIVGEPVRMASVPGGFYSRKVAAAAARAGITTLFTSEPVISVHRVDGCVVRGRFAVRSGTSEERIEALASRRMLPRVQQYLSWNSRKLLKAVGGKAWLAARNDILRRSAGAGR